MNAATTWGNGFCLVLGFKVMFFPVRFTKFLHSFLLGFFLLFRAAKSIACSLNCIPLPSEQLKYWQDLHKNSNSWGLDSFFWNFLKSYKIIKFLPCENISTNAPVQKDFSSKLLYIYQNSRAVSNQERVMMACL